MRNFSKRKTLCSTLINSKCFSHHSDYNVQTEFTDLLLCVFNIMRGFCFVRFVNSQPSIYLFKVIYNSSM